MFDCQRVSALSPEVALPTSDGKRLTFSSYRKQAPLWFQATNLERGKTAAALIRQMGDVSRQVRMTSGKDHITKDDGAQQISRTSRDHFAPDAVGASYREVVV